MIADIDRLPVEIQIRTFWQHLWAELSEWWDRMVPADVKYGGGDPWLRQALDEMNRRISTYEEKERRGVASSEDLRDLGDSLMLPMGVMLGAEITRAVVDAVRRKRNRPR